MNWSKFAVEFMFAVAVAVVLFALLRIEAKIDGIDNGVVDLQSRLGRVEERQVAQWTALNKYIMKYRVQDEQAK
jgi:hypothetical protein